MDPAAAKQLVSACAACARNPGNPGNPLAAQLGRRRSDGSLTYLGRAAVQLFGHGVVPSARRRLRRRRQAVQTLRRCPSAATVTATTVYASTVTAYAVTATPVAPVTTAAAQGSANPVSRGIRSGVLGWAASR